MASHSQSISYLPVKFNDKLTGMAIYLQTISYTTSRWHDKWIFLSSNAVYISFLGCLPCNCSTTYSMHNATCHPVTGQCACIKSRLGGVYSGRTCEECDVNAIGIPPDCELCHSPCYGNWQQYIGKVS